MLISPFTKEFNYLLNRISSQQDYVTFKTYFVKEIDDIDLLWDSINSYVIMDFTDSIALRTYSEALAEKHGQIHFISNQPYEEERYNYGIYTYNSLKSIGDALVSLLNYYDWNRIILITSVEFSAINYIGIDSHIAIVSQITIILDLDTDTMKKQISRMIKPLGVRVVVIATDEKTSIKLQEIFINCDMNTEGYAFIFVSTAAWTAKMEGSLLIEYGTNLPTSSEDYIEFSLYQLSKIIIDGTNSNTLRAPSDVEVKKYILDTYKQAKINSKFTIYNVVDQKIVAIGTIEGDALEVNQLAIFPGNSTVPPDNNKISLKFSISGGSSNPGGAVFAANTQYHKGSVYAAEEINNENEGLLRNFNFELFNISGCGCFRYVHDFAYDCFKANKQNIGLFHIGPIATDMNFGIFNIFQELSLTTPLMVYSTGLIFNNEIYFPQVTRVNIPNIYSANAIVMLLTTYNIRQVSLIHSNSTWGYDFANEFNEIAERIGIKVLNKKRVIPLGFKNQTAGIDALKEIVDSKSRYVVNEVSPNDIISVFDEFYQLGMRKGNLIFIGGELTASQADFNEALIGSEKFKIRREIADGALFFGLPSYVDEQSQKLEKGFARRFGSSNIGMCLFYDMVYLGAYALDYLITYGININSESIAKAIRLVRFKGCSGTMKIDDAGVNRSIIQYMMYTFVLENNTMVQKGVGLYNPLLVNIFEMKIRIPWVSEDGELPVEIRGSDLECPFFPSQVKKYDTGYIILCMVYCFLIIVIFSLMKCLSSLIFGPKYPKLDTAIEASSLDDFMYALMLVESLQYLALGPLGNSNFPTLAKLGDQTLFNLTIFSWWSYWTYLSFAIAVSLLWILMFLVNFFAIEERTNNFCVAHFSIISKFGLPFIAEFMFIPVISALIQVFKCLEMVDDEYSVHANDCKQKCWEDSHLFYVIVSSISLIHFIPTVLYFKLTWKYRTNADAFHFVEQFPHIAFKMLLQVTLVNLKVILSSKYLDEYKYCYVIMFAAYIAVCTFNKPYNYHRASLWYLVFIYCVITFGIFVIIGENNIILGLCIVLISWVMIWVLGLIVQHKYLPSLLKSAKPKEIGNLFRFELSHQSAIEAGISDLRSKYFSSLSYDDGNKDIESIRHMIGT